ncbi:glycosyltransferase [Deinococcus aquaticus]|uniref:glycosyltransferase n=1 Tax=Deinococcus aquaticus TaxID=328692 RepID=UPI003F48F388
MSDSVFILVNSLNMGGAEIQAIRNAEALKLAGYKPIIITPYISKGDFFAEQALEKNIEIVNILNETRNRQKGFRRILLFLLIIKRLLQLYRKRLPNFVYIRGWFPGLFAIPLLFIGAKIVYNEENSLIHNKNLLKFIIRILLINVYKRIISPSDGLADEIRKYSICGDVFTMPNIIEDVPSPRGDFISKPPKIGYIGRFSPQKRVDRIIEVASLLPDLEFWVAGSGPDITLLEKEDKPENIYVQEPYKDSGKFYKMVDVLILVSDYEGFANVIIEANSHGLPVVSTNVPHGPSDLIKEGLNGFLVDSYTPEVFSIAIRESIELIKVNGKRKIIQSYALNFTVASQSVRWMEYLG